MQKIIIKEIDKLHSSLHKNYIVSEYLIYVMVDENQTLEAYTELGEAAKNARINELILVHFMDEDNQGIVTKEDIIEEITFEEYSKDLKRIVKK